MPNLRYVINMTDLVIITEKIRAYYPNILLSDCGCIILWNAYFYLTTLNLVIFIFLVGDVKIHRPFVMLVYQLYRFQYGFQSCPGSS